MNDLNPRALQMAAGEWSDWLEEPDNNINFKVDDIWRWINRRPPLCAFSDLAKAIGVMQDEIDLQAMKINELREELKEVRRQLIKRA